MPIMANGGGARSAFDEIVRSFEDKLWFDISDGETDSHHARNFRHRLKPQPYDDEQGCLGTKCWHSSFINSLASTTPEIWINAIS